MSKIKADGQGLTSTGQPGPCVSGSLNLGMRDADKRVLKSRCAVGKDSAQTARRPAKRRFFTGNRVNACKEMWPLQTRGNDLHLSKTKRE